MISSFQGVIYINEDMFSVKSFYIVLELGANPNTSTPLPPFTLEKDNHLPHRLTPSIFCTHHNIKIVT